MNFNDLYRKIQAIDEGTVVECGEPMHPSQPPQQQDSVTMNVSMNGSGANGIKDLMSILKNIEDGGNSNGGDMVIDMPGEVPSELEDSFKNAVQGASEQETMPMSAVIATGNDIHSKGGEAEKVNGGGNPMQRDIDESLVAKLSAMYDEIKEGKKSKPDFLDMDKDGNKKEPMKKALKDKTD